MKKTIYALCFASLACACPLLWADTGVIVHETNGKTTFFPAENVEYVDFVEDYIPETDPTTPLPDEETVVPDDYIYPLSYVKLPDGTPQQVKEYTGFTLNFNKDNHTPNYVAWELLDSETSGDVSRDKYSYWVDRTIDGCLDTDYAYSTTGYERGHMCPAADQKWSEAAMKDCMSMSNMCPQLATLNGGIWAKLEDKERDWAQRDGAIWIVAGPIYSDEDTQYIGKATARVPGAFFKAFLYNDEKNPRAIAFAFTNGSNPGNIEDYAMSIDDLEEILGYDLFPALPDEVEKVVEASYSFSDWNK